MPPSAAPAAFQTLGSRVARGRAAVDGAAGGQDTLSSQKVALGVELQPVSACGSGPPPVGRSGSCTVHPLAGPEPTGIEGLALHVPAPQLPAARGAPPPRRVPAQRVVLREAVCSEPSPQVLASAAEGDHVGLLPEDSCVETSQG